ncbi:MAG: DoxX family membrane protein, partial [Bacteroidia bacterium]
AGVFAARIFLGLLFLFQGYDAVFNIGMPRVVETYRNGFEGKHVPGFLVLCASWFTSLTELICGALLLFGLFEYCALYLLSLNLIIAAIGFGITGPMWDSKHVFPRLVLILVLLFVPEHWNLWSLDALIFKP